MSPCKGQGIPEPSQAKSSSIYLTHFEPVLSLSRSHSLPPLYSIHLTLKQKWFRYSPSYFPAPHVRIAITTRHTTVVTSTYSPCTSTPQSSALSLRPRHSSLWPNYATAC